MSHDKHHPTCECCSDPESFQDKLDKGIRAVGFSVVATSYIAEDGVERSVAYTVGFAEKGLPELIVFGIGPRDAHIVLSNTSHKMLEGSLKCSVPQDEILMRDVYLLPTLPHLTTQYMRFAEERVGGFVPTLQLVLYDRNGKFPWQPGYDAAKATSQPNLFIQHGSAVVAPSPSNNGGDDPSSVFAAISEKYGPLLQELAELQSALGRSVRPDPPEERGIGHRMKLH